MDVIGNYLWGTISEGLVVGGLFWVISFLVIESTSLRGALIAGLASEAIGNLPYLFGMPPLSPPSLLLAVVGGVIFVRLILRVGELTPMRAIFGTLMTYFALLAIVSCS